MTDNTTEPVQNPAFSEPTTFVGVAKTREFYEQKLAEERAENDQWARKLNEVWVEVAALRAGHLTPDEARHLLDLLEEPYRPAQYSWQATRLPAPHIQRLLDKLERLARG